LIIEKHPFRWVVLLLTVLVNMFVCGMSLSCMPTLYSEIARDIPMTYTQWGGLIDSTGKESVAFIFWGTLMLMGGLFILPMKETGFKGKVFPSEKRDIVESRV
jgi:hypothetical protein